MNNAGRGEVWMVDLGLAAKVRPCVVVSVPIEEHDRVLITLVPHTTSSRGTRFEVTVAVRFLRQGAFDAQNLITIPRSRLIRKLGRLSSTQMPPIEAAIRAWLGL